MSVLSWGKYLLEHATSTNGAPAGAWTAIDTPREGSGTLTPTQGNETNANEEGGDLVDSRRGKTTYTFEWYNFVKKGTSAPFVDDDGLVAGEHALRITPEDPDCEGIQIDRCTISVQEEFTSADGKLLHYTAKALKPAAGKSVKPYVAGSLTVTPTALYFANAADSTGKTITATSTGNVSATADESWITVTCSGKVATVKVTANNTGALRTGNVTVTADGNTAVVPVMQIPA